MKADKTDNPQFFENYSQSWSQNSKWLINSPSAVEKNDFVFVQEAGAFITFNPYFTERENLNSFYIQVTTKGQGALIYRNETFAVKRGDCFFIDCNEYHKYETKQNDNWDFLWLHFYGENAKKYYDKFMEKGENIVKLVDDNVEKLINDIICELERPSQLSSLLMSKYILEIVTDLILTKQNSMLNTNYPDYVQATINFINANYTRKISLDEISEATFTSKFYLSREFSKFVGVSIHQYIIQKRIAESKRLLQTSNMSIEDISFVIGISNASHFISLFSNLVGLTPHQYRLKWKS